jgi:hypothetical protein
MDTWLTPVWVTKDVAAFWKNEIKFVGQMDRSWDDSFRNKPEGAQIGYTVLARIPQRFTVSEGQALVQQAILNQSVPITINHQQHVGMGWSSADASLEVEEVQERYTMPAGEALGNKVDVVAAAEVFQSVYNFIGSPGVPLSANQTWLNGVALLQNLGVPGPYQAVVDPRTQAAILGANLAQFNPQKQIGEYFRSGLFGEEALGVQEWFYDPNLPTFTTGQFTASTPLVNGSLQTGATLVIQGLGTYSFMAGDAFTILGVDSVNPVSYVDTGSLQQFRITAPVSGSGTATLSITPSIITSGQLQTVTVSPANNAQIFFQGATSAVNGTLSPQTSRQSFIGNFKAFAFVMADLKENLAGARTAMARSKSAKISMRWAEQYNIQTDQNPSRVDIIYGVAPVLPYFILQAWS